MKCDKYIGCDLHQATTVVAVLDTEGKVVMETIVATEAAAIIRFLKSLSGALHITFDDNPGDVERISKKGEITLRHPNSQIP